MSKKITVIAYFTPPFGEVGSVRITKFLKMLPSFGHTIKLITVKDKYYSEEALNMDSLKDIQGISIKRTKRLPKFFKKINEEGFYWFPFLLFELVKECRREKPDILFFTGGPFYQWLVAPFIKLLFDINYILDFRDAWRLNPYKKPTQTFFSKFNERIEGFMEPFIIKHSKVALQVTSQATQLYQKRYPQYSQKFITITNGYDPDDFTTIQSQKLSNFSIVYSGKFGTFRNVKPFFVAFKRFITQQNLNSAEARFIWIGKPEDHILNLIKELDLNSHICLLGFKPYQENLNYISGSDICLLIAGNHPYEATTKVFDYLALNKPILAIVEVDGFLTETLKEVKSAFLLKNEEEAIQNCISDLYSKRKNKSLTISSRDSKALEFNRYLISKKLSNIIDRIE